MMKDEPDDEPDDDDEPLDEVLPADDDTMVTMAWQAMAPDGKQWREVPLPTAQQLLIIALLLIIRRAISHHHLRNLIII